MKALVLAGGQGTRLRPLTFAVPKPMLPIAGVAFLERLLRRLSACGLREVVLATSYRREAIEEHLGDGASLGMQLFYCHEETPLGTGGAMKNAQAHLDETFVVLNGDILTGLDLPSLISFHRSKHAAATIALKRVDDPSAFGLVVCDEQDRVEQFIEKPEAGVNLGNWVNAGTYVLEPEVLATIPSGKAVSVERETFPALLNSGAHVYAFTRDAYWLDIGNPQKYLQANADVLGGLVEDVPGSLIAPGVWMRGNANVHDGASLHPPVLICDKAHIEKGAHVGPFTVVGPGSIVEQKARVSNSVVLELCRIGAGAEVDSAILSPGAHVEPGARPSKNCVVAPATAARE